MRQLLVALTHPLLSEVCGVGWGVDHTLPSVLQAPPAPMPSPHLMASSSICLLFFFLPK